MLGQTDIFSHFINLDQIKGGNISAYNEAMSKSPTKAADATDKRHRKTEKEEDEELLKEESAEKSSTTITESPDCKPHAVI